MHLDVSKLFLAKTYHIKASLLHVGPIFRQPSLQKRDAERIPPVWMKKIELTFPFLKPTVKSTLEELMI